MTDARGGGTGGAAPREVAVALEAGLAACEIPPAASCAELAAAWERAGEAEVAARWAVRAVDGGADFTAWRTAARVLDRVLPEGAPGQVRTHRVAVLGTSTTTPLVPCLRLALAREGIGGPLHEAAFGQYWQEVLDPASPLWRFRPDVVVLVPDHRALAVAPLVDDPDGWVDAELARLTAPWEALAAAGVATVQVSVVEPPHDALGQLAAGLPVTRRARLRALHRRLAEAAAAAGVGFVDAEALAAAVGKERWFDDRYWHAAKHAVALPAVPRLAAAIASVVAARSGLTRKCLVLDLDNTLWGGVVGDDGVDGIVLRGARGDAYREVQHTVAELAERGVVLAVCSKNDPATAREPFEVHPDMVLSLDHVAVFDASWDTKPEAIRRIADRLGLGLDALVLVDDNPVEREDVRRSLPEVDVLALPPDPASWRATILGHPRLEPASLTDDDRRRTSQYRARAEAVSLRRSAASLEEFQASLDMAAVVEPLTGRNLERAAQLLAKTNQFNLTVRRHPVERLRAVVEHDRWAGWALRLSDRFTDHGIVAVVLVEEIAGALEVDNLVMSCRVIGRGLEHVAAGVIVDEARRRGLAIVRATYVPTDRNGLVADLWSRLGFREVDRRADGSVAFELADLDTVADRAPIAVERSHA